MNIKPIRTDEDYEAACKRIDEIFQAALGTSEEDELEILLTLVEKYEKRHFPIGMPDPIEAIEIQSQSLNISRKDLMDCLAKSSGRISDILNRRRPLTLNDIRKLNKLLHIPIEVLFQEYPLERAKPKQAHRRTERAATGM